MRIVFFVFSIILLLSIMPAKAVVPENSIAGTIIGRTSDEWMLVISDEDAACRVYADYTFSYLQINRVNEQTSMFIRFFNQNFGEPKTMFSTIFVEFYDVNGNGADAGAINKCTSSTKQYNITNF